MLSNMLSLLKFVSIFNIVIYPFYELYQTHVYENHKRQTSNRLKH